MTPTPLVLSPEQEIKPRQRQTWTKDTAKLLSRAIRVFVENGVTVALMCNDCRTQIKREANPDGVDLVCECKRRVITRGL